MSIAIGSTGHEGSWNAGSSARLARPRGEVSAPTTSGEAALMTDGFAGGSSGDGEEVRAEVAALQQALLSLYQHPADGGGVPSSPSEEKQPPAPPTAVLPAPGFEVPPSQGTPRVIPPLGSGTLPAPIRTFPHPTGEGAAPSAPPRPVESDSPSAVAAPGAGSTTIPPRNLAVGSNAPGFDDERAAAA